MCWEVITLFKHSTVTEFDVTAFRYGDLYVVPYNYDTGSYGAVAPAMLVVLKVTPALLTCMLFPRDRAPSLLDLRPEHFTGSTPNMALAGAPQPTGRNLFQ